MTKITEKQNNVVKYISYYNKKYKHQPTLKQVSEHFGWKQPASAFLHLKAYEKNSGKCPYCGKEIEK